MTDHADVIREARTEALNLFARYNRDPGGISYEDDHVRVMNLLRAIGPALDALVAERDEWRSRAAKLEAERDAHVCPRDTNGMHLDRLRERNKATEASVDVIYRERDRARQDRHDALTRAEAAEAEVARLRETLTDQCEMNEQALGELRQLHKEWPLMTEQTNFDGEPLIVEVLRGVIDDLDTGPSRAALAKEDTDE